MAQLGILYKYAPSFICASTQDSGSGSMEPSTALEKSPATDLGGIPKAELIFSVKYVHTDSVSA